MEGLLKEFPNTLVLRVRMPIVADLTYPRNFITKIIKYDRVRCMRACAAMLKVFEHGVALSVLMCEYTVALPNQR